MLQKHRNFYMEYNALAHEMYFQKSMLNEGSGDILQKQISK